MIRNKYGAGGYNLMDSEIHDLIISINAIKAALSQNTTFPADISLALREVDHILDMFGIEL